MVDMKKVAPERRVPAGLLLPPFWRTFRTILSALYGTYFIWPAHTATVDVTGKGREILSALLSALDLKISACAPMLIEAAAIFGI
ncbi:MAG: hypothetical protein ACQERI_02170 [Candidatus Krumholzibacteriota bacterium]